MNFHGRFGAVAGLRQHGADERDVFVHGGILDDAIALTNSLRDGGAELLLLFVGNLQIVHLLCPFQDRAELACGAAGDAALARRRQQRGSRTAIPTLRAIVRMFRTPEPSAARWPTFPYRPEGYRHSARR